MQLYIILIRPERNVRPTVRAGRPNQTKSSAITATNASSMMGPVTATTVLTAATCDQNKAIKKHIASTMDCSTQSECKSLEISVLFPDNSIIILTRFFIFPFTYCVLQITRNSSAFFVRRLRNEGTEKRGIADDMHLAINANDC